MPSLPSVPRRCAGLLLAAALVAPLPATAEVKRVAVTAVALDRRLDRDAVAVSLALREVARNDPRFELLDPAVKARGDDPRSRAAKAEQGRAMLRQALDSLDSMDTALALERVGKAVKLHQATDLSLGVGPLLDALAVRALVRFAAGEPELGAEELQAIATIDPEHAIDPARQNPDVSKALDDARERAGEAAPTSLEVQSSPVPAAVWVDGVFRGVTPLEVKQLRPGSHFVTLVADGYELAQERHVAAPGQIARITLPLAFDGRSLVARQDELKGALLYGTPGPTGGALAEWAGADELVVVALAEREGARHLVGTRLSRDGKLLASVDRLAAAAGPQDPGALSALWKELFSAAPPRSGAAVAAATPEGPRPDTTDGSKKWAYVAAVGGGVALIGSIALGVSASDKAEEARGTPQLDTGAYQNAVSTGKGLAVFADICLGLAIVGGASSAYLFLGGGAPPAAAPPPSSSDDDDLSSLSVVPLPSGAQVSYGRTF